MKAIVQEKYGSPDVLQLREIERPSAGAAEVLVKVYASTVTLPDCAFRKADPFIVRFFTGFLRPRTKVPGTVFAGIIEATGPGVKAWKRGDPVYGATNLTNGAHAEYMRVSPEKDIIAPKPASLSFDQAAGACYSFLTAMPFLRDEARLQPGQRILINGASGSVGTVAVQLAKHKGADVTAVCSTHNVELVKSLGADHVIDYTREDFTAAGAAYDVIFDVVGKSSFARCRNALKPTGIYLTTVPSFAIAWTMVMTGRSAGKRGRLATTGLRPADAQTRDLLLLNQFADAGVLRPVIDRTYPLEGIADAHRYVEAERKRGDVIITIPHHAVS